MLPLLFLSFNFLFPSAVFQKSAISGICVKFRVELKLFAKIPSLSLKARLLFKYQETDHVTIDEEARESQWAFEEPIFKSLWRVTDLTNQHLNFLKTEFLKLIFVHHWAMQSLKENHSVLVNTQWKNYASDFTVSKIMWGLEQVKIITGLRIALLDPPLSNLKEQLIWNMSLWSGCCCSWTSSLNIY